MALQLVLLVLQVAILPVVQYSAYNAGRTPTQLTVEAPDARVVLKDHISTTLAQLL